MRKLSKELINFVALKALELSIIKSFHHHTGREGGRDRDWGGLLGGSERYGVSGDALVCK
jgi:hypothetical protein